MPHLPSVKFFISSIRTSSQWQALYWVPWKKSPPQSHEPRRG
jgi:hypothetical protein